MRKLFSILSIALVTLFAVGCQPNDKPGVDGNKDLTLTNVVANSNTIKATITPADKSAKYFAGIVLNSEVESLNDSAIINNYLQTFTMYNGEQIISVNNLEEQTEYCVIAFMYGATDEVVRKVVTTTAKEEPVPSIEFDVDIEVSDITAYSATAVAKPSSTANRYYFRVITKMELDAMGIYNDDFQIFEYIIENPNSGDYITWGDTTINCSLSPKMNYIAVAFNFENWEAVHNMEENVRLFRYEFSTPDAAPVDPNSLFTYSNLKTTTKGMSVDVVPAKGEESFWAYYFWTKSSYDSTLASEGSSSIVMRSYWALQNIGVEQGYDFHTFINEYIGQTGASTVINYEPLDNDTEYVLVLFYMDPGATDPTDVYDYSYVPIEFKTKAPTAGAEATLEVSEPVIKKEGFKYNVQFVVKTNENATDLKVGAQLWNNYDFAKYWDPNDWSQIQAFFMFRTSVEEETLAAAKSAEGATISFPGVDKDDYVFFFEAINEENTPTQFAVRVEPSAFNNVQ